MTSFRFSYYLLFVDIRGTGINGACKMAPGYGAPFLDGVSIKSA